MSKIVQGAVKRSTRDVKKSMRVVKKLADSGKVLKEKTVHFGDPELNIKKGQPARKESYCARNGGIKGKDDPFSANYQSRKAWDC